MASLFTKCIAIKMIMWDLSFKMYLWRIFHVVTFPQLICMRGGCHWKALICWELHPSLKQYKALGHQQPARLIHSPSLVSLGLSVGYVRHCLIRLELDLGGDSIKMTSYWYRKSHCGDKITIISSYLHNKIFITGKMVSLYWIRALDCKSGS